jgi:hypothetical protein
MRILFAGAFMILTRVEPLRVRYIRVFLETRQGTEINRPFTQL